MDSLFQTLINNISGESKCLNLETLFVNRQFTLGSQDRKGPLLAEKPWQCAKFAMRVGDLNSQMDYLVCSLTFNIC